MPQLMLMNVIECDRIIIELKGDLRTTFVGARMRETKQLAANIPLYFRHLRLPLLRLRSVEGGDELLGPLKPQGRSNGDVCLLSVASKESFYSDGCLVPLDYLKCPRRRRRRRWATSRSARRQNVCTICETSSLFWCRTLVSSLWWSATASWEPSPSKPWLFTSIHLN